MMFINKILMTLAVLMVSTFTYANDFHEYVDSFGGFTFDTDITRTSVTFSTSDVSDYYTGLPDVDGFSSYKEVLDAYDGKPATKIELNTLGITLYQFEVDEEGYSPKITIVPETDTFENAYLDFTFTQETQDGNLESGREHVGNRTGFVFFKDLSDKGYFLIEFGTVKTSLNSHDPGTFNILVSYDIAEAAGSVKLTEDAQGFNFPFREYHVDGSGSSSCFAGSYTDEDAVVTDTERVVWSPTYSNCETGQPLLSLNGTNRSVGLNLLTGEFIDR